jgi:N-acetylmuramoyl-L-alanine amidase
MREITKFIIHCSGSDKDKTKFCHINEWHKSNGWGRGRSVACGYHFVIEGDGTIVTGRRLDEVGAHCRGENKKSIGVCLCGGDLDLEESNDFNEVQFQSLNSLLKVLKKSYPEATIHPHREFVNKACPSFDINKRINV